VVRIDADLVTPADAGLIPTGELRAVAGTPFDFRKATAIGARIDARDQQIQFGGGYDHNWALNGGAGTLRKVIEAYSPRSGRVLTVATTEPGCSSTRGTFSTAS
jgi:aldose 1-epimerase